MSVTSLINLCRSSSLRIFARRNLGLSAVALQKTATAADPIQQLFVQKVREYATKKKALGADKLVEATPSEETELKNELDKVAKAFGGGAGVNMTEFPSFKFQEPTVDPIELK